jgi:tetratricopeptide (TPR) repeat protein
MNTSPTTKKPGSLGGILLGLGLVLALLAWVLFGSGYFYQDTGDNNDSDLPTTDKADVAMESAFNRRNWTRLEAACRELLDQDPFHAEARFNLGYSLFQQDRLDEAETEYLQARDFSEYRDYATFNLACIYARQDKPDRAIEFLQSVLDRGFASVRGIGQNQDLKSLQDRPEFAGLVEQESRNRGNRKQGQQK